MKRALASVAWVLVAVALTVPAVNAWLGAVMWRLMLLEIPAWILLGWLAGRRFQDKRPGWNPKGLTGLVFFLGALGFWMIPRSVDAIGMYQPVNQLMHASLLWAGALLSMSIPALPFVFRAATGIYAASMTFSLGMLYSKFDATLCGTFDLYQQRTLGKYLLIAAPVVAVLVVAAGARALVRVGRRGDVGARVIE